MHPLHKHLPKPDVESAEWHAFVDGLSAAGPEGIPPIFLTEEGFVLDGARRLQAAKQLQWTKLAGIYRPETEAASIMVESLLGQRSLSKGAKVYLCLNLLPDYAKSAEIRRLSNLKRGTKTLEKPRNLPNRTQYLSGNNADEIAAWLGCSGRLFEQAVRIRRFFDLPRLAETKIPYQDGTSATLREYFEPRILDAVHPMGLGEVLKGIGALVDEEGNVREQFPPERNSHLFYWERSWAGWAKQCSRWDALNTQEQAKAVAVVKDALRDVPEAVLENLTEVASEEKKRRRKVAVRAESKEAA